MNSVKTFLVASGITLVVLIVFGYGMMRQNPYIFMIPLVLPFLVLGLSKPELLVVVALAILNSKLVLPGLPGELELFHIFLVFAGGILFVRYFISKERMITDGYLRLVTLAYGAVVFYTMLARGIGFRVMGSGQAGGMRYVMIFIGILTLWFVPNVKVHRLTLKRTLVVSALLSFLPVVAEIVFLLSGGRIQYHYHFMQAGFGLGMSLMDMFRGEGVRFMSAAILGRGLVYLPFFVFEFKRAHWPKYMILIFSGLLIGALSGFRSVLISNVLFLFIIGILMFRGYRKRYIMAWFVTGLTGFILLYVTFDLLPFGIQRSVSFLPFIATGSEALRDANSTIDFRLGIWEMALKEIPEYLLLGRGLAFNFNELIAVEQSHWMEGRQYVRGLIGNLHNGPLEALIYLGIPGALCFLLFLWRGGFVAVRTFNQPYNSGETKRLVAFFTALLLTSTVLFFVSFGNPYSTFLTMCVNLSLVIVLGKRDALMMTSSEEAEAVLGA